jgi:hypothetical protein
MKASRFLNLAILSVLVGSTALVYAQEEKPQEDKSRQEDTRGQKQDQQRGQEQSAKPQGQEHPAMHNDHANTNQDTRGEKQDQQRGQEQSARPQGQEQRQERPEMQGDHNRPANQDTRGEKQDQQRGQEHPQMQNDRNQQHSEMRGNNGRKGGHIPDDRFRAQFGREHRFNARSVIVRGRPQFQYGGYNFEYVDAWPSDWSDSDDYYIDYIDGDYYLIDLVHPGIRLALFVVM